MVNNVTHDATNEIPKKIVTMRNFANIQTK